MSWPRRCPRGENKRSLELCCHKGNWSRVAIPVTNGSKQDITLSPRTVLGKLQQGKAIYPVDVRPAHASDPAVRTACSKDTAKTSEPTVRTACQRNTAKSDNILEKHQEQHRQGDKVKQHVWDPSVSVDHLTTDQQEKVRQMLREECVALSKDDNDVGCIPSLQLKFRLSDTTPVRRTYISVPKPLHKEVKEYLEDLLNRGWMNTSRSPYSSPIVCVRRKDGSLRLCIDYRELNQQSIPDRHPIPKVQDMLNRLR
ncbi:Retrovirus-related Pol polyprotein from transposon 17.6 [Liparis tanakae]|uniref:Retrovirus-related Pol polyprotein from transposon 17.6 n=1 Tax=Liparis tanakae TaxID=230148 RepID=A0A4Z2EQ29_9TELE|nr:Retrovirus-related Pol polyprotein from transposon 17.6 [Liparis tanakae]